jgi:hypothetical protein
MLIFAAAFIVKFKDANGPEPAWPILLAMTWFAGGITLIARDSRWSGFVSIPAVSLFALLVMVAAIPVDGPAAIFGLSNWLYVQVAAAAAYWMLAIAAIKTADTHHWKDRPADE